MVEQLTFFPPEPAPERGPDGSPSQECDVPGARYIPSFLTPEEQAEFIQRIDENKSAWLTELSRRVQHYGWRYDYQARAITSDMHLGPLPDWLQALAQRLYETGLFERPPEQVIVNEYEPGQGIAMHTDHSGFGSAVATVSLGDDWVMDFSRPGDPPQAKSHVLLERGSVLILTEDARKKWRHGIAKRKKERSGHQRKRRLSLTFRTVRADGSSE